MGYILITGTIFRSTVDLDPLRLLVEPLLRLGQVVVAVAARDELLGLFLRVQIGGYDC